MRGARPEYNEPSARIVDATDIGSQHPARYGQNDCEIALTRKNALFAGHDDGAENWAIVASLIEACKLNDVEPQAYLADVLVKRLSGCISVPAGKDPPADACGVWCRCCVTGRTHPLPASRFDDRQTSRLGSGMPIMQG